jgi:hypothetical protein
VASEAEEGMTMKVLRNMRFARAAVSSIEDAALIPEVGLALVRWVQNKVHNKVPGVLIGGLAMSFYAPPRATQDVDLLFLSNADIPKEVPGFKQKRRGAFEENETQVEVETVTPVSVHIPQTCVEQVFRTAWVAPLGLRIASREGLIALKLYGADNPKRALQDKADIQRLLEGAPDTDMSTWHLSEKHQRLFEEIRSIVKK